MAGRGQSPNQSSAERSAADQLRGRALASLLILLTLAAAVIVAFVTGLDWYRALPEGLAAEYVGTQSCVACHEAQFNDWRGSDHDFAMKEPTPETVLADFSDVTFNYHGIESRMWTENGRYYMSTDGPDGEIERFEIKWTFGWQPLQQYLVEFDDGRVQCLPITWDTVRKEWFHLYPEEKLDHTDPLHWTKPAQNWNYMCADCHSTNVQLKFDGAANRFHTSFDEINVSCESCHGPGSIHVAAAERKSLFWDRRYGKGLTVTLKDADNVTQINACAKCHSRRSPMFAGMTPGDKYLDYYAPELIANDLYFDDGQILDEVYVYGSFLQSRMYDEGVKCSDCHDPHTTKLKFQGNALCTQCHIPEDYDTPSHHHHPQGKVGSSCVDCHMPQRTYMQVDPRRDHSFRVPRPDLSVALGVPNTCNTCHYDRDAQWAADAITEWTGVRHEVGDHFAYAFHGGKEGDPSAESDLIKIAHSDEHRDIVRASALSLLRHYRTERSVDAVADALDDPDDLVRWAAVQTLAELAPPSMPQQLTPALRDSVRLIRMQAAQALSPVPRNEASAEDRQALDAALDDYIRGQLEAHEPMTARFNLGVIYTNVGRVDEARTMYRQAIRLDPEFLPARFNLAMLEYAQGRHAVAEAELRSIIEVAPDDPEAHFSLGVLLWELEGRREEAVEPLARAVELAPERADVRYNYGLALQHLGRVDEAEAELRAAAEIAPDDTALLYALAVFYAQQERWPDAIMYSDRLLTIDPGHPTWLRLRGEIERRSGGGG